jgi:apolipoprotein N-acyltransferase
VAFWRAFAQPARYASLLAGGLVALAFPAPNAEFLGWCGLVPGLLLMRQAVSGREAAVRGWWFGTGFLTAALYWLLPDLGPGLILIGVVLGVLWTGVGAAIWSLLRPPVTARRAAAALLVVPGCWVSVELVRSWQGLGGPWAVLGASQWQHPVFLSLAAVGGVWLVSFALVLANTGLVIAVVAGGLRVRVLGAAAALAALAAGPAAFALTPAAPVTRQLTVALVQPGQVGSPALRVDASQRLTTGQRVRGADLIVWGESSVAYDLDTDHALLGQLRSVARASGTQILVNQDSVSPAGDKSKVAVLVGGNGVDGRYVKSRLVPLGEYLPFRQQLGWLTRISKAAPQNMIPGTGAKVLRVTPAAAPPLTVGVLICFESAFSDMSRVDTSRGAQVIVYQTSDSTFQGTWALAQHASLGAVRAAETGRPVVQAALTGDSAAFDPRGRVLAWAGPDYRGVLQARLALPATTARTPYDRFGDYLPWTSVGLAALAGLAGLTRRARRRPDAPVSGGEAADWSPPPEAAHSLGQQPPA